MKFISIVRFLISNLKFQMLALVASCVIGCAGPDAPHTEESPVPVNPSHATTAPATAESGNPVWNAVSKVFGRPGVEKDGVYIITVPRDDLEVHIDHMAIPTAAGIESVFYFYACPCGKMNVAGQFVACDYEANDIVDALRPNAILRVSTIAPMFLYENPRLTIVRFQGEGDPVAMAGLIREALRWTGRERMAPDTPFPKLEPRQ